MHTRILTKHHSTYSVNLPRELVQHLALEAGDKLVLSLAYDPASIRIAPVYHNRRSTVKVREPPRSQP